MKTTMKTQENRPELSFDGFGINGPDEYRTRLCTFSKGTSEDDRKKYGPLFAAAPELLEALKETVSTMWQHFEYHHDGEDDCGSEFAQRALDKARAAIAKAEGKVVQS